VIKSSFRIAIFRYQSDNQCFQLLADCDLLTCTLLPWCGRGRWAWSSYGGS